MIIPSIWKNKKCSKPPTSIDLLGEFTNNFIAILTKTNIFSSKQLDWTNANLAKAVGFKPASEQKTGATNSLDIFIGLSLMGNNT